MEIPKNTLWQYLEKEHLDSNNKLTDEQWQEFLDEFSVQFGEKTAEMGHNMLHNFKIEIKIGEDNVLESGVEIEVQPPGKKLQNASLLSGGEKALTSIALISAIIANNPSPFVILDEVDAALDEANSIRFAEILAELSNKTQFIAITHNRATMQESKIIYGITMSDDGLSNLLSMNFEEADKIAS